MDVDKLTDPLLQTHFKRIPDRNLPSPKAWGRKEKSNTDQGQRADSWGGYVYGDTVTGVP
jgi:hypothetical protein